MSTDIGMRGFQGASPGPENEGRTARTGVTCRTVHVIQLLATHGLVIGTLSIILFLLIWQFLSTYVVNPFLIPPPSQVVRAAIPMVSSGEYFADVEISLWRVFVGFVTGAVAAIAVGLVLGRLRIFGQWFDPIIELMRYLSPTAMIPIAVIWFGIGEMSKYFLIFWGTFFILVISTIDGVAHVPVTRVRAAQCLGATRLQIFTRIILPTIVPIIITGMRLSMASAFMSIIPAEMLAADSGLGYLLQASAALAQTTRIFVALVTISVLGVVVDALLRFMARHLLSRYTTYLSAS